MKRLALAVATGLILLANLPTQAQDNGADDLSAVQATVKNYIEAYYTGDVHRMEQTLHPQYLKHKVHPDIPVRDQTGAELLGDVPNGPNAIPAAQRTEKITVLDVTGNCIREVGDAGLDGLHDTREGEWGVEGSISGAAI